MSSTSLFQFDFCVHFFLDYLNNNRNLILKKLESYIFGADTNFISYWKINRVATWYNYKSFENKE